MTCPLKPSLWCCMEKECMQSHEKICVRGYLKLFLFVSLKSHCFPRVPTVPLETGMEK